MGAEEHAARAAAVVSEWARLIRGGLTTTAGPCLTGRPDAEPGNGGPVHLAFAPPGRPEGAARPAAAHPRLKDELACRPGLVER